MPHSMDRPLADKVAIVTGASRNIGRATALGLAADGAAVVVVGHSDAEATRKTAGEIAEAGGRALAHIADVGDPAAVADMADAAMEAFGRIDILVNNAAIRRQQPFETMTLAQWREILGVILDGSFLCARHCIGQMIAGGGGAIVNIGGLSAHAGAQARAHVVAAKAGVVGLTKALAVEFADRGIRANCVVPGTIDILRGPSAEAPPAPPGGGHAPLGRLGRPEEVAAMVCYLCRPESAYMTGQTLHVNGGRYLP